MQILLCGIEALYTLNLLSIDNFWGNINSLQILSCIHTMKNT